MLLVLKIVNLVLQLLVAWEVYRFYVSPWVFTRWRRTWGCMGVAIGLLLVRRVYAFWDDQALLDVLLSSVVSVGMVTGFRNLYGILSTDLQPHPPVLLAHITMNMFSQILQWDAGAVALFHWTAEEAVGKTLFETIIPSQDWEAHRTGMARYLAQDPATRRLRGMYTVTGRRKDGIEIPVEITLMSVDGTSPTPEFQAILHPLVPL